jgi:hypothetical protein
MQLSLTSAIALVATTDDWQMLSANLHTSGFSQRCASEYDWTTFINIYASGRWDPLRTPNPPVNFQSTQVSGGVGQTPNSAVESTSSTLISFEHDSQLSRSPIQPQTQTLRTQSQSETESLYQSSIKPPPILSTTLSLPPSTHRSRPSFSELRTISPGSPPIPDPGQSGSATSPELLATAAATMRVAGSRIDLSPLVLPSPEHELTDPMRDHTTTIPGSVLPEMTQSRPTTPTSTRKSRLTSFWHGTQDIDEGSSITIGESNSRIRSWDRSMTAVGQLQRPASVPTVEIIPGDYFGNLEPISEEVSKETQLAFIRAASPLVEIGSLPVPGFPRTTSLTRQASSPLPVTTLSDPPLPGSRLRSEGSNSTKAATSAKEEQPFAGLDCLAPPNPPDELDRSRALHK